MKIILIIALAVLSKPVFASQSNKETDELIRKFHSQGITKCDQLILKHNFIHKDHPNWYYDISYSKSK